MQKSTLLAARAGAGHFPLERPAEGASARLSEVTIHGECAYVIERDDILGRPMFVGVLLYWRRDSNQAPACLSAQPKADSPLPTPGPSIDGRLFH